MKWVCIGEKVRRISFNKGTFCENMRIVIIIFFVLCSNLFVKIELYGENVISEGMHSLIHFDIKKSVSDFFKNSILAEDTAFLSELEIKFEKFQRKYGNIRSYSLFKSIDISNVKRNYYVISYEKAPVFMRADLFLIYKRGPAIVDFSISSVMDEIIPKELYLNNKENMR